MKNFLDHGFTRFLPGSLPASWEGGWWSDSWKVSPFALDQQDGGETKSSPGSPLIVQLPFQP